MVVFSCGHQKPVSAFRGGACGECRSKAQRERNARRREEWAARQTGAPKFKLDDQGRLPHGARFDGLVYDAERQMWSGTLLIPVGPTPLPNVCVGHYEKFSGSASGVERLLRDLARQYREWAAARVRP